jgi:peptidoglycan-associated lipoprotein
MHGPEAAALLAALAMLAMASGCKKHPPAAASLPPPPAASQPSSMSGKPVINSFTAEPSRVETGQASTLRWSVSNATDVSVDQGLGALQSSGQRSVTPSRTTTYTLTANGPGGSDTRSITVEVSAPLAPPSESPKAPSLSGAEMLHQQGEDAYFDYNRFDVRADAQAALTHDAELLRRILSQDSGFSAVVEGHCDERGSAEYNLALGDKRANAAKDFLVQHSIPAERLKTVSYGKEQPQCTEATEDCWQKNRRAHLAPSQ